MHNPVIKDEVFYVPLLQQFLQQWTGQELIFVMDTSMFWDTYCLIEVYVAWGGRCLVALPPLSPDHGSATRQQKKLERRIEFSKVISFSY